MTQRRSVPVPEGLDGLRLDAAISRLFGVSRTAAAQIVSSGGASLDGVQSMKSDRVTAGATLDVDLPSPDAAPSRPPEVVPGLRVVHEDDDILVVDKPVGVAAHPSPGWDGPTVIGGLAAAGHRVSTSGAEERQGVVHRLDVGTSGLMVVAKSERAYTVLKDAFRERTVDKRYHALVQGHPDPLTGTVDAPIDRHPTSAYKFAVVAGGRDSVTHYETIEAFRHATLLEIHLETGRTHQIRVHMAALKHPCVGDLTYGADPVLSKRLGLERQWLHAVRLSFAHPDDGRWVSYESGYPDDLRTALDRVAAAFMILKTLDDRLVPRMAAGLRRLLDRLTPGRSTATGDEPSGKGGFLGLLRDVPQLAALLAAVVFLAAAGLFLLLRSGDDTVAGPTPSPVAPGAVRPSTAMTGAVLGLREGADIGSYVSRTAARTDQLAVQDPEATTIALVSLTEYVAPQAAADLLAGVEARRVYVRAPDAGELAEVLEVPTPSDLVQTLRGFYATTAAAKQEDAREFQGLADSIEETSEEETAAKQAYVADAQRASAEANAYAADCACVLALVVEGPAGALAELADNPLVRAVEAADRSARLETLQVFPVRPDHEGTVPPPPVEGGPTVPGEGE